MTQRCYSCGTTYTFGPCPTCERNRLLAENNELVRQGQRDAEERARSAERQAEREAERRFQREQEAEERRWWLSLTPAQQQAVIEQRADEEAARIATEIAKAEAELRELNKSTRITIGSIYCRECSYQGRMGFISDSTNAGYWIQVLILIAIPVVLYYIPIEGFTKIAIGVFGGIPWCFWWVSIFWDSPVIRKRKCPSCCREITVDGNDGGIRSNDGYCGQSNQATNASPKPRTTQSKEDPRSAALGDRLLNWAKSANSLSEAERLAKEMYQNASSEEMASQNGEAIGRRFKEWLTENPNRKEYVAAIGAGVFAAEHGSEMPPDIRATLLRELS